MNAPFNYNDYGSDQLSDEQRQDWLETAAFEHELGAHEYRDDICTVLRSHDRLEAEVKRLNELREIKPVSRPTLDPIEGY